MHPPSDFPSSPPGRKEWTLLEKILLAAAALEEAGQSPVSAEALIVAAWKRHPRTFGLKGYEDHYPDSNKVLSGIMGEKGLPKRGWLAKVGQKLYALTREGRQVARLLVGAEPADVPDAPGPRLSRAQDLQLQALLASAVWQKARQGRQNDWTFSEAARFWDLGERQGQAVDERLIEFRDRLQGAEVVLGSAGSAQLGNGKLVRAAEARQLLEIDEQLAGRFARHLQVLRTRGERKN